MEDILMSEKEAERLRLMKNHADGMISLHAVSNLLDLSYRQTLRIWNNFKLKGAAGLVSRKRKNQNRSLDPDLEQTILTLIRKKYHDYGPTLITEKLKEKHQIQISKESIRKIMIKIGLRASKKQKKVKVYQRRMRRSCFGELEQVDGSPHAWFEDRGPRCTLLLAVDDATGKITAGRFEEEETTEGYFRLIKAYIQSHGKPACLYTDKYSSFYVSHGEDRSKPTQFNRAMKELGIKMIAAHSPQAKGRIERTNGILQDRLVKELREKGISTIEEANLFLPTFIEDHNKRFEKIPASPFNAHRTLEHNQNLDQILCNKESRKISKNLEVHYKNKIYQIQAPNRINRLRGTGVQVIEKIDGTIQIDYKGELLEFIVYKEFSEQPSIVDHKTLVLHLDKASKKQHKPHKHHPWRNGRKSVNF
ncbi:MAG: ISNCY family transposase [Candidatus Rhabdochlamydia sp.]